MLLNFLIAGFIVGIPFITKVLVMALLVRIIVKLVIRRVNRRREF